MPSSSSATSQYDRGWPAISADAKRRNAWACPMVKRSLPAVRRANLCQDSWKSALLDANLWRSAEGSLAGSMKPIWASRASATRRIDRDWGLPARPRSVRGWPPVLLRTRFWSSASSSSDMRCGAGPLKGPAVVQMRPLGSCVLNHWRAPPALEASRFLALSPSPPMSRRPAPPSRERVRGLLHGLQGPS